MQGYALKATLFSSRPVKNLYCQFSMVRQEVSDLSGKKRAGEKWEVKSKTMVFPKASGKFALRAKQKCSARHNPCCGRQCTQAKVDTNTDNHYCEV